MENAPLLRLVSSLTQPGDRAAAAGTLARAIGAEDLILFLPDLEVDALLPAPGFPQTLPKAREWQTFLAACVDRAPAKARLCFPDEKHEVEALGVASDGGQVLVLLGGNPSVELAYDVALLLPLVGAALGAERLARVAEAQATFAKQAANQAKLLASSLDRARISLRRALVDAETANRAKDAFLAALSHELRTPLNPVLMTATSMELDPSLPQEVREQAALIRRNTELEARLIDDLLDLTRITHGKLTLIPTAVDVHTLLSETEGIVSSEISDKQLNLLFRKEASEHYVNGDPTRLQQVFWNVIKNAVKFTPPGGRICVTTGNPAQDRISIQVTDTGLGIAPEVLSSIFNAFEQGGISTHRFGGLGLGLAITRALVQMHGGTIRANSEGKGRGATFTIELSTIPAPTPVLAQAGAPVSQVNSGTLRILLIEDHESTRDVLSRILQRSGYKVLVAGSGKEARQIAASSRFFDVVISDIGLPDESGLDLMRALKSQYNLRGIALSGYGMEEDIKNAKAAGYIAHLVKPVNFGRLKELLDQVAAGTLS